MDLIQNFLSSKLMETIWFYAKLNLNYPQIRFVKFQKHAVSSVLYAIYAPAHSN